MHTSDFLRDQIEEALKRRDADYVEVHFEEKGTTRIQYRGRELEDISESTSLGGNVRALVKGGWGFVSFNEFDGLQEKVELAVRQARLVGKGVSEFAPVPPVVDLVESVVVSPQTQ